MKLTLASVAPRKSGAKSDPTAALVTDYINRASRLEPSEALIFPTEAALLAATDRLPGRPAAILLLFDSAGDLATSTQFAQYLARLRDDGAQRILFGIGPADGWSPIARAKAAQIFSLGRMTLPHELARAVVAEQIYRALTILAGHPYHCGH